MARDLPQKLEVARRVLGKARAWQIVDDLWPRPEDIEVRAAYKEKVRKWATGKNTRTIDLHFFNRLATALRYGGSQATLMDCSIAEFVQEIADELEGIDVQDIAGAQPAADLSHLKSDISEDDFGRFFDACRGRYAFLEMGRDVRSLEPMIYCQFIEVRGIDRRERRVEIALLESALEEREYPGYLYLTERNVYFLIFGDNRALPPLFATFYRPHPPIAYLYGIKCQCMPTATTSIPVAARVLMIKGDFPDTAARFFRPADPDYAPLFRILNNALDATRHHVKLRAESTEDEAILAYLSNSSLFSGGTDRER